MFEEYPHVPFEKKNNLAEFRAVAEIDSKLNRGKRYVDPVQAAQLKVPGWPNAGGPKFLYYYRENQDGTTRLVADPNGPYCNTNYTESVDGENKHRNKYTDKGYRLLAHTELLATIDAQQRWHMERWEAQEAPADAAPTPAKRGRPRKEAIA